MGRFFWVIFFQIFFIFQFATYHHVKQIPPDFYRLGIQMKGIVRELDKNGKIRVEHLPAYKLPKILRFGRSSKAKVFFQDLNTF